MVRGIYLFWNSLHFSHRFLRLILVLLYFPVPTNYFPKQNMLMQFNCTSPPHIPGTVDVHIYVNGTQISNIPTRFNYECPPGTASPINPSDDCIPCQPGYYSPDRNGTCLECPIGTYSTKSGAVGCTTCPIGTVSATPHAISSAVCIPCAVGYYWNNGQCIPCPIGTFTRCA